VECGLRLGACWVFVPRATAANAAAAPQGMCTAPQSGHNKVSSLYVAARSGMLRVGNEVSSFYGTQADQRGVRQLGDVGGDALDLVKNSAGTLLIPVPISPSKMDGIEPFVRWGAARLGALAMHGVMRALIARWAALIAMLGLLALVIATSRTPCVPYGLWPTLQMHCR
jgi:hypothetical protein